MVRSTLCCVVPTLDRPLSVQEASRLYNFEEQPLVLRDTLPVGTGLYLRNQFAIPGVGFRHFTNTLQQRLRESRDSCLYCSVKLGVRYVLALDRYNPTCDRRADFEEVRVREFRLIVRFYELIQTLVTRNMKLLHQYQVNYDYYLVFVMRKYDSRFPKDIQDSICSFLVDSRGLDFQMDLSLMNDCYTQLIRQSVILRQSQVYCCFLNTIVN
jgi:hypothetical protein